MNPFGYLPILAQQHQEELLKEAAQYRMVKEALRVDKSPKRNSSRIIALLEKELACLGFSLEVRYGVQPEALSMFTRQSNPGDCA